VPEVHDARPGLAWSDVATLLRERNYRLTPQRRMVVAALAEFDGHVTTAQLLERCIAKDPDFVPSTVYRTLDLLEELGLITHIHDAEGHEEYHPAAERPHAHLICRDCGTTREVAADELGPFVGHMSRHHAFEVDVSHLAVFGRCRQCAQGISAG
jgi:Fur family ferric uptake transcriptional regulator